MFLTGDSTVFRGRSVEWFVLQQPEEWQQLLEAISAAITATLQRNLPVGATQSRGDRAGLAGLRFGPSVQRCMNSFAEYWYASPDRHGGAVLDVNFAGLAADQAATVRTTLGWLLPICKNIEYTVMEEFENRQESWQGHERGLGASGDDDERLQRHPTLPGGVASGYEA